MDSTTVCDTSMIEACLAMASARAVRLESECSKQKLKLELLRGSRPKLEILPISVVVHKHLVRAGCMFFGTTTRRTLTRLHRQAGTAFADLLSAMEALPEAFLAGKSWVFIRELHVLHLWVNFQPSHAWLLR